MKKWVFLSCALAAALLAAGFLPLFSPALPENEAVLPGGGSTARAYIIRKAPWPPPRRPTS